MEIITFDSLQSRKDAINESLSTIRFGIILNMSSIRRTGLPMMQIMLTISRLRGSISMSCLLSPRH